MRVLFDDEFLAGQAFACMPLGINGDFDAWRNQPTLRENVAKLRAIAKQKPWSVKSQETNRHRRARTAVQGCA